MTSQPNIDFRRRMAGLCLIAAPLTLLAGDLMRIAAGSYYGFAVAAKVAFGLFAGAVLAIVHLLSTRADRTGLVGGTMTILGSYAGASIVTAGLIASTLEGAAFDASAMQAIKAAMLGGGVREYLFFYPISGLFFPAGLLVLSAGLWRARVAPPAAAVLLALGAILFPVGRIPAIDWAIVASGVALSASMGAIGWRVLTWTVEEWERVPDYGERSGVEVISHG